MVTIYLMPQSKSRQRHPEQTVVKSLFRLLQGCLPGYAVQRIDQIRIQAAVLQRLLETAAIGFDPGQQGIASGNLMIRKQIPVGKDGLPA